MKPHFHQKGQALILIALAAIGLFAFAALAIDGSRVYSEKRHAQNAADTAAMAGALAYTRAAEEDKEDDVEINLIITDAAQSRATSNGYDNNGASNDVTVLASDVPSNECPNNTAGKDITVTILFHVDTTFTRVIGRNQVTNAVTATSRACDFYYGPPFGGNIIVSLGKDGIGFDAHGSTSVTMIGGGVLSNSTHSPSVWCGGSATVTAPTITAAGPTNVGGCYTGASPTSMPQIPPSSYSALFPPEPICNGTATYNAGDGKWHPDSNVDFAQTGSTVALSGNMAFAPGLYCVTNSPVNAVDTLKGSEVTFYMMRSDFNMKLNGNGEGMEATAPTDPSNPYKGILIYLAPQFDVSGNLIKTQALDVRGNGATGIVGSIIAPSAQVTMYANSNNTANNSQVIAYNVDFQGGATVKIDYDPKKNFEINLPNVLTMLE